MMKAGGVIVTRPEPGLSETMRAVEQAGWRAYASPALHVIQYETVLSSVANPAGIILTSGQAVCGAQAITADRWLPVYAVGDRTAQRAQAAGFHRVYSAQGNAEALVALLKKQVAPSAGTLLLLAGDGQGNALHARLQAEGFDVVRHVTYAALPAENIDEAVQLALIKEGISNILFFSAESARGWIRALSPGAALVQARKTTALVISEKTAEVLLAAGWQHVRVALRPDAQSVLSLLEHK